MVCWNNQEAKQRGYYYSFQEAYAMNTLSNTVMAIGMCWNKYIFQHFKPKSKVFFFITPYYRSVQKERNQTIRDAPSIGKPNIKLKGVLSPWPPPVKDFPTINLQEFTKSISQQRPILQTMISSCSKKLM